MISMGAFVASGGMDTLRNHAIAVSIGDVLTDDSEHQTFVDFRFRFISQQARTFFLQQSTVETTENVYPYSVEKVPAKLVSLISDDHCVNDASDTMFRSSQATIEKTRGEGGFSGLVRGDDSKVHGNEDSRVGESLVREKVTFLPDTSWIARTDALSTILRPCTNSESVLKNEKSEPIDKPRHAAERSYLSDSSDASGHTTCEGSDHEFAFIGPRQKRTSSLMETQDSVELARNYWNKHRVA